MTSLTQSSRSVEGSRGQNVSGCEHGGNEENFSHNPSLAPPPVSIVSLQSLNLSLRLWVWAEKPGKGGEVEAKGREVRDSGSQPLAAELLHGTV